MNILSRRGFLRGVGSVGAAAIAVSTPATTQAQSAENPELVALAPKLAAAEEAFHAAHEAKCQAVAAFNAICPPVPPELISAGARSGTDPFFCAQREEDAEGHVIWSSDGHSSRWIIPASNLRIDVQDYSARTRFGRLARQKLTVAEAYEDAREKALAACGVSAAIEARYWAVHDLEDVSNAIHSAEALTMAGVVLKARAMAACAATGSDLQYRAPLLWGRSLADAVLRVGGQGSAT